MKKTLLTLSCLASFYGFSQVIQSQNFNGLTIGNVGTAISGATAGQGGLYTYASNGTAPTTTNNSANSNFQIVAGGNNSSQGFQLVGPNGDKGARYMWLNGLATAWGGRTTGNDKIEVEYDFFTGPASTSTNVAGVQLYDASFNTLCGFYYNMNSGILQGIAYLNNGGTPGHFTIDLGPANTDLILSPNTWYSVGFGYDTVTGEPYWKVGASAIVSIGNTFWEAPTGLEEIDFAFESSGTNAAVGSIVFDNYSVKATATQNLLGTSDFNTLPASVTNVYPNPVVDFASINISDAQINAITVMDINGRIVKQANSSEIQNAKINLSDLTAGVYLMTIDTDKGVSTEKIVKK